MSVLFVCLCDLLCVRVCFRLGCMFPSAAMSRRYLQGCPFRLPSHGAYHATHAMPDLISLALRLIVRRQQKIEHVCVYVYVLRV